MSSLGPDQIERRFLLLRATRWFPTGLIIPVFVLYLIDKGLTLGQIGLVTAAQGAMVLLLELPTGGLADALGRRRVLIVANGFELVSVTMILLAPGVGWFITAFAIQGVYRALESGPLEAWFVDGIHRLDPGAGVERGLSRGGIVIGAALALGAVIGGGLVAIHPFPALEALATPIAVSLGLRVIDTVMLVLLMTEIRPPAGLRVVLESARGVPGVIRSAFGVLKRSTALKFLLAVEVTWGVGAITWEGLFPARLGSVMGAGEAAAAMGPLTAAAWAASAAGAAVVMWFSRRLGPHATAAWIRLIQAATVVGLGAFGGVVGLATAYLTCFAMLGASGPIHMTLVHEQAEASNRTTVTSLNNMCGMAAAGLSGIILGSIADASGIPVAMFIGAVVVVTAGPLYLLAGRRPTRRTATSEV